LFCLDKYSCGIFRVITCHAWHMCHVLIATVLHTELFYFHYSNILKHRVKTGSGAHPGSYPVGTWVCLPGVKLPVREGGHTSTFVLSLRMRGAIPALPITSSCSALLSNGYIFLEWYLVKHKTTLRLTSMKSVVLLM
jgi:hypothetical protein